MGLKIGGLGELVDPRVAGGEEGVHALAIRGRRPDVSADDALARLEEGGNTAVTSGTGWSG